MIELSTNVSTLLNSDKIIAIYLVDIGGTYQTTHYTDITLSNGNTYLGNSSLVAVDPPRINSTVDREAYSLIFADSSFIDESSFEGGLVGIPVEIRLGLIDPNTMQPLTALADTIIVYSGTVDNISYAIDTNDIGNAEITVTCASPMNNLEMKKVFYGSKTFVRERIDPDDSAFDQVYEGSNAIRLKWGKA
jgi:hypothetical protein